jgi:CO/xanthine dehydrogenase FAD-binding subunit
MHRDLTVYDLRTPPDLPAALDLLSQEPGVWRAFAGGTDLMVLLEAGKLRHRRYLNIWDLPELHGITVTEQSISLGALATYTEVQAHPLLQAEFPMLCQAARETGGVAIQNRGTLGGNIVNASPAADSGPALLAYEAEVELVSVAGSRIVPYSQFHSGYKQMDLHPDELLRAIHLPRVDRADLWVDYYRKVGTRKAQAISKVCFAQRARMEAGARIGAIRIALGSVAPVVMRCPRTEQFLIGRRLDPETVAGACAVLSSEIAPIDDIRSTAVYRRQVALNLLEDALLQLVTR